MTMKKSTSISILLGALMALTICTGCSIDQEVVEITSATPGSDGPRSTLSDEDRIPVNQLVVGTLKLEGTEFEVSTDQAQTLLVLWKAYRGLLESDITVQAELQAVLNQVQSTMTVEQIEAIRSMEITSEEITRLAEDYDLFPDDLPEGVGDVNLPGGGPGAGGFPEGGFDGGQGPRFEGETSPEQMATAQAMREERGGIGSRVASFLVTPLIELLESKVGD